MKTKRRFFIIFLVGCLSARCEISRAASTLDAPTHLTLEKAVSVAIRNSTGVLKSENSDTLNGEALLQSYAQFLPNLNLAAGYNYQTGTQIYAIQGVALVDSRTNNAQYQVSTTLNLFNGLSDFAHFKAAEDRKHASELSLSWAKQQVALDITQSFLQVTLDQQILEIAKKNLAASLARLKLFQGEAEVGSVSTADLFREQAQAASDEQYLITSETRLHDDQLIVIQKLRMDPTSNYILDTPDLAPEIVSEQEQMKQHQEDQLIDEAVRTRQDYRAQEHAVRANQWDITQARSGYLPRLDLSADRNAAGTYANRLLVNGTDSLPSYQQPVLGQLGNQVQWEIGLTLSWAIFDRFVTRLNVQQAQVTEDNAHIDQDDLRIQITAQVRQITNDLLEAQRQLVSTQVGLKAANQAYEVIEGRYKVGSSTFIDLLASQSAMVQAQAANSQSLINLKLQERLVKYYLGRYTFEQD